MYISEIRLKNFKKFENAKFLFNRGINVIKGQNENGKSTLLKGIIAGLYADPSSLKTRDVYKTWNQNIFSIIELDFFIDDNLYVLTKDFNTKEVLLKNILLQTEERNATFIQRQVQEYTGMLNEKVLRATSAISSVDITAIDSGKKSLHEALQSIAFDTESVDFLSLLKDLENKIEAMQVGLYHPAKNDGILKKLQSEIAERFDQVEEEKDIRANFDTSQEKLNGLLKELSDVDGQIQKYAQTVGAFEKKDEIQKELDTLNEKIRIGAVDVSKLREIEERITLVDKKFESFGGDAILDLLNESQKNLIAINGQMQEFQTQLSHIRVIPAGTVQIAKKTNYFPLYFILAFIALGSILTGFYLSNILFVFIGMLIATITIVIFFVFSRKNLEDENDYEKPVNEFEALQIKIQELKSRQNAILQTCFMQSNDEFFSRRTQLIALKSDKSQMLLTVEVLLRGNNLRQIQIELDENIQRKAELEVKMPVEEVMSKEQFMRDKRELDLLKLDKKDIENEMREIKTKLSVWNVDVDKSKEDELKLELLQRQLLEAEHLLEVYKAVFNAFVETKTEISIDISEHIQTYISDSLANITNERYTKLQMDNNFAIKVYSNEKREWISPHPDLSRGTIDQIYISARIALARLITGGKAFPLFFDDPFLTFDDKRRNMMLNELMKIAENNQIFIFTCHDFFDNLGNIISL